MICIQQCNVSFNLILSKNLLVFFIAERRVSYSTADEESSPRGSHDLIEEPQLAGNVEKKGLIFLKFF